MLDNCRHGSEAVLRGPSIVMAVNLFDLLVDKRTLLPGRAWGGIFFLMAIWAYISDKWVVNVL